MRIYKNTVLRWASASGVSAGTLIGLYFLYLTSLGLITVTGYSGDTICAGTLEDPCYAFVRFTANEDIFLYPLEYDPYNRNTGVNFKPDVKEWKLERSWGNGWREIDLNKTCTGTWCGAPDNKGVAYSFVFRKGREYEVRITALKEDPTQDIKWSAFGVDPVFYGTEKYKFYDNISNTVILKDKQLNNISTIKLDTPQVVKVGMGYQQVAEYTQNINGIKETIGLFTFVKKGDKVEWIPTFAFNDTTGEVNIKSFELIDLKMNKQINRTIDIKVKTTQKISVPEYGENCITLSNSTELCSRIQIGSHLEDNTIWEDYLKSIIGIDIEVNEWATWEEYLNTGLTDYWTYDIVNATGNATYNNITGTYDRRIYGSNFELATGLTRNGLNFTNLGSFSVVNRTFNYNTSFTENFWIKGIFDKTAQNFVYKTDPTLTGTTEYFEFNVRNNGTFGWAPSWADYGYPQGNITLSNNTWYMVTIQNDGIGVGTFRVFINGDLGYKQTRTETTDFTALYSQLQSSFPTVSVKNLIVDEHGRWNRTLNESEITILYNEGNGCTYQLCDAIDTAPVITLNSPVDNYNSTSSSVTFNATVSDDINLVNVSLWGNWSDWHLNETNTSGINNTEYIFTKTIADGTYLWGIEAWDNNSQNTFSSNRTFTIDTVLPTITIHSPENITYNGTGAIDLDVTADETIDTWWYQLNSNGTNLTFTPNTTITPSGGANNVTVYANDSIGNENSSIVHFTVLLETSNLTLVFGTGISYLHYEPTGLNNYTFTALEPENQTSTIGCVNITNDDTDASIIYARLDASITNVTYTLNTEYNFATGLNLTTANQTLISNLASEATQTVWCWVSANNRRTTLALPALVFNG